MLTATSRYGIRVARGTEQIIEQCRRDGQFIQGPAIRRFERAFEHRVGHGSAIATSYGRMAFYHILKALELPPGSEIVVPALTFWVIPELARMAGLRPVFADVDPKTFTLDPQSLERAIGPNTRAVVPTHLYGLPCDMDAIMDIARRHRLAVVEDCAHALGATYHGRQVGTFGDGALFSFQTLKPLNAYGGGVALVDDAAVAARVRQQVSSLPWPSEDRIVKRLRIGRLQRVFTSPRVFSATAFPILWAASWLNWNPDVYLWEPIRRLDPLPAGYTERFSNVQAAIGLAALAQLEEWTAITRAHARQMDAALKDLPGVTTPYVPSNCGHVYYQYCLYTPDRDDVVKRCIRRGVDLETLHVDVCSSLPLFDEFQSSTPHAELAAGVVQVPVYASLSDPQLERIAMTVRDVLHSRGHQAANRSAPAA